MSTCTVTGTLADLSLEPVEGVRLSFAATPPAVSREGGSTILPDAISVTSGTGGAVSVDLVPGAYRLRVHGQTATYVADVTVPDAALAYLHQILDLPPPESLDAVEQAVLDAQTARDDANAAAALAEQWAEEPEDSEVEPGQYSALHHAAKAQAAEAGAATERGLAQTARAGAETAQGAAETARATTEGYRGETLAARDTTLSARDTTQGYRAETLTARDVTLGHRNAAQAAQSGAETAEGRAQDAQAASETARDESQAASVAAQAWAESDTAPGGAGTQSAKTWAGEAQVFAQDAAAVAPSITAQLGQVASTLGQVVGRVDEVAAAQDGGQTLTALASVIGQLSQRVSGGQVELRGGTLDDPALRIGTVGIYSAAADTLSVAIAGTEVARFDASGLTIYGTVTEQ